jgi:hypothetical protein
VSKPVTYLAGPMKGHPCHNYPAFEKAVWRLREEGHTIISPHEINAPMAFKTIEERNALASECLKKDIMALLICNRVMVLPKWEASAGVRLELHIAQMLGMEIVYLSEEYIQ